VRDLQAFHPMPQHKKLRVFAAMFFWGMILSCLWVAPGVYGHAARGAADFSTFYTAGKIVQRGQGHQLYDWGVQTQVQSEFSRTAALRNRALPYMRPPYEALLFLPLSYLSYPRAYVVWVLLNMLLVGLTAAFLRSRIPDLPTIQWWLYYPAVFSFCPIAFGFLMGQDSALMLLLFGLAMVHWLEHKDFRAGCFLGLALIKFQLVLPLIFILCLKRQFRTLAGFSLVAILLSGIGVWVVGWEGMVAYPGFLWRLSQMGVAAAIYPNMMPSLRGLLQGWTDALHPSPSLVLITGLLSLVVLVWAAAQWRVQAPRPSKIYWAGVAIVFLATLLVGYHEYSYDLSLLLPVVLRSANTGLQNRELDATTRWSLMLGSAALLCAPLYLLLIAKGQLNLIAVPELLLASGLARAIKIWQSAESITGTTSSLQESIS
jgi:hypothetical protein